MSNGVGSGAADDALKQQNLKLAQTVEENNMKHRQVHAVQYRTLIPSCAPCVLSFSSSIDF